MTDVMPMGQQAAQVAAPGTMPVIRSTATTHAGITPDVAASSASASASASDISPPQELSQTSPAPRAGNQVETGTLARLPAADDTLPYETVENAMADIFDYLAYRPDQE